MEPEDVAKHKYCLLAFKTTIKIVFNDIFETI